MEEHKVSDVNAKLRLKGIVVSLEWIKQAINYLESNLGLYLAGDALAEKVFELFLDADIYESNDDQDIIPPNIMNLHKVLVFTDKPAILQICEILNVGASSMQNEASAGKEGGFVAGKPLFKMFLTDGRNKVVGLDMCSTLVGKQGNLLASPGCKVLVSKILVRRGALIFSPASVQVLGGEVLRLKAMCSAKGDGHGDSDGTASGAVALRSVGNGNENVPPAVNRIPSQTNGSMSGTLQSAATAAAPVIQLQYSDAPTVSVRLNSQGSNVNNGGRDVSGRDVNISANTSNNVSGTHNTYSNATLSSYSTNSSGSSSISNYSNSNHITNSSSSSRSSINGLYNMQPVPAAQPPPQQQSLYPPYNQQFNANSTNSNNYGSSNNFSINSYPPHNQQNQMSLVQKQLSPQQYFTPETINPQSGSLAPTSAFNSSGGMHMTDDDMMAAAMMEVEGDEQAQLEALMQAEMEMETDLLQQQRQERWKTTSGGNLMSFPIAQQQASHVLVPAVLQQLPGEGGGRYEDDDAEYLMQLEADSTSFLGNTTAATATAQEEEEEGEMVLHQVPMEHNQLLSAADSDYGYNRLETARESRSDVSSKDSTAQESVRPLDVYEDYHSYESYGPDYQANEESSWLDDQFPPAAASSLNDSTDLGGGLLGVESRNHSSEMVVDEGRVDQSVRQTHLNLDTVEAGTAVPQLFRTVAPVVNFCDLPIPSNLTSLNSRRTTANALGHFRVHCLAMKLHKFKIDDNLNLYEIVVDLRDGRDTLKARISSSLCEKFLGVSVDDYRAMTAGLDKKSASEVKKGLLRRFLTFHGYFWLEVNPPNSSSNVDGDIPLTQGRSRKNAPSKSSSKGAKIKDKNAEEVFLTVVDFAEDDVVDLCHTMINQYTAAARA